VLVVTDVHLAQRAAPALLKTIEEPPGETVFILLADDLPPELGTVASRCVQVVFPPVPRGLIADWLVGLGVDPDRAAGVAEGSGGDVGRARLLVEDPGFADRLGLWRSIPARLTGSGSVVAQLTDALVAATESALEPLRRQHAEQMAELLAEAETLGERTVPGRKEILERQHREERRWRSHELRVGFGVLARAYRDRMSAALATGGRPAVVGACEQAVGLIGRSAASLDHNPNETLLLEALLVRLGRIGE
jgi:DNA polymerase-3 subunit delta'